MIATSVKCRYLCKVSFYVGISIREKIQTAMKVSERPSMIHNKSLVHHLLIFIKKSPDTKTVGGMKLTLKEFTAGVSHIA